MRFIYFGLLFFTLSVFKIQAQQKPSFIIQSGPIHIIPPLTSIKDLPKPVHRGEVNKKRHAGQNNIVPGKGLPKGADPLVKFLKTTQRRIQNTPLLTFEAANDGATPSDPTGAPGPNHYVMAYNTAFKIFDKSGQVLVPETALSALFPGHTSDGDPIVLYDQFADRFVITNFDITATPNKLLVAVSQTADPVNGGWYVYPFEIPGTTSSNFIDYPKFSIWSDGYYITSNKDATTASTDNVVYVMERDQMIAGNQSAQLIGFPLPGITTNGFYSPSGFNVTGYQMPPAGNAPIIFMQDDAWAGVNQDHLKIWYINVDWQTPSNSTISDVPDEIPTTPFNSVFDNGSFSNLPQPNGIKIDALQATMMFMTNYRRFSNYNSVVLNFVVNTDGQGKAGIRWYELRQDADNAPWTIYQEGTYIDPSGHSTFAGSINMDKYNNIGLGYTIVDVDQVPELHYTGRLASDVLNQMTLGATIITPGVNSDPFSRYGDYAQLSLDPSDNLSFWFISEYFTDLGRSDYVAVFKFGTDLDYDVGVAEITAPVSGTLSNSETISLKLQNYGLQSVGNFTVSYQIDGGTVITENFNGTIAPHDSALFSFATPADLSIEGHTYTITARTNLSTDQDVNNDAITASVEHVYANDMGVTAIISPQSGFGLTNSEPVTVLIKNFGGVTQTDVPVSFTLNGQDVQEIAPGPYDANTTASYTFNQTVDLSQMGQYDLTVATHLPNDSQTANDSLSTTILHSMCQPESDCSQGDAIIQVQFADINNSSTCGGSGYTDFSNLSTDLEKGQTYQLSVTVTYSQEFFTAWIDFNNNFQFEDDEKIVADYELGAGSTGDGQFTQTFDIKIPEDAISGEHLMRLRTNWQNPVPDACSNVDYGETEDYKVNILGNILPDDTEINIETLENNHFSISFNSRNITADLILEVYNIHGQRLVYHILKNNSGTYSYDLDLRFVAKGVYLLKIGNNQIGKIQKIIVR